MSFTGLDNYVTKFQSSFISEWMKMLKCIATQPVPSVNVHQTDFAAAVNIGNNYAVPSYPRLYNFVQAASNSSLN